jgi:hypothetical protein
VSVPGRCVAAARGMSSMGSENAEQYEPSDDNDSYRYGYGYLNKVGWALGWKKRGAMPMYCRWCDGSLLTAENSFHYFCIHCDHVPYSMQDVLAEMFDIPEWPGPCEDDCLDGDDPYCDWDDF